MLAPDTVPFRRLVLDLCTVVGDGAALRAAAELAHLLRIDLRGLFIEDPALSRIAGLPGVRELRLPLRGWQALDAARIGDEVLQMTARAERLLAEISASTGVTSGFETLRGKATEIIAGSDLTDILVLAIPRRPGLHPGDGFAARCAAAERAGLSVLLVPATQPPRHGPVVVSGEVGLAIAARIAERAGEDLVILLADPARRRGIAERLLQSSLAARHVKFLPVTHAGSSALTRLLAGVRPRLCVLARDSTRAPDLLALSRIAASCEIPVLAMPRAEQAG